MIEDFHFKGVDPLKVFKSSSKLIIGIIPILLFVIGMFISLALVANQDDEMLDQAMEWKKECHKYFLFRTPQIVYYKDYTPIIWCTVESQKIKHGQIPFDYKKDLK